MSVCDARAEDPRSFPVATAPDRSAFQSELPLLDRARRRAASPRLPPCVCDDDVEVRHVHRLCARRRLVGEIPLAAPRLHTSTSPAPSGQRVCADRVTRAAGLARNEGLEARFERTCPRSEPVGSEQGRSAPSGPHVESRAGEHHSEHSGAQDLPPHPARVGGALARGCRPVDPPSSSKRPTRRPAASRPPSRRRRPPVAAPARPTRGSRGRRGTAALPSPRRARGPRSRRLPRIACRATRARSRAGPPRIASGAAIARGEWHAS